MVSACLLVCGQVIKMCITTTYSWWAFITCCWFCFCPQRIVWFALFEANQKTFQRDIPENKHVFYLPRASLLRWSSRYLLSSIHVSSFSALWTAWIMSLESIRIYTLEISKFFAVTAPLQKTTSFKYQIGQLFRFWESQHNLDQPAETDGLVNT